MAPLLRVSAVAASKIHAIAIAGSVPTREPNKISDLLAFATAKICDSQVFVV